MVSCAYGGIKYDFITDTIINTRIQLHTIVHCVAVAQLVEHGLSNQKVLGTIPTVAHPN